MFVINSPFHKPFCDSESIFENSNIQSYFDKNMNNLSIRSGADRRRSNRIWVINDFIATYIRGFTVRTEAM